MKIPYKMQAAVSVADRRANMLHAISRGLPKLDTSPMRGGDRIWLAAYGPSLRDTWRDLQHPCIGMSGATRFLADRGFIPDYHVDMDPRPHKVRMITPPVPGVTYLIASHCEPTFFEVLKNERVLLWHAVSSDMDSDVAWVSAHDPNQLVVSTGSNVGLGALQIAGILGYRHFELHGYDHSLVGADHTDHHAGVHTSLKPQRPEVSWAVNHKKYYTSKILANGAAEVVRTFKSFPIFGVFHGTGLVQALIDEENLPNACSVSQPDKANFVRSARANFLDYDLAPKAKNIWEALCFSAPDPAWVPELQIQWEVAERRRHLAAFNTGSISLETGLILRSICAWKKPSTIIEVGTFIGKSTHALVADHIYTCDKDNDCLPSTDRIHTFPKQTSRQMFEALLTQGVKADLFFFDGRISDSEIPLVLSLSAPDAIYVFDDFKPGPTGKGMANAAKLLPALPGYAIIRPYEVFEDRTTLAMAIPFHMKSEVAA